MTDQPVLVRAGDVGTASPHRLPAIAPAAGNFDPGICERADVESGLKSTLVRDQPALRS